MRGWKSTYIKDGIWEVGNDKVASLSDMAAGEGAMVEIMAMTSILALKVMMAVQVLVTMAATIKTIMMAMRTLLVENIYLFDTLAGTAAIATLERWAASSNIGRSRLLAHLPPPSLAHPPPPSPSCGSSILASWVPTQQVVWWASMRKDVWLQLRWVEVCEMCETEHPGRLSLGNHRGESHKGRSRIASRLSWLPTGREPSRSNLDVGGELEPA